MPNTRVRFTSGLLAGIITGTLFQIVQWGCITIETLKLRGLNTIPFARTPEFAVLSKTLETFGKAIENLPENRLLKDV